MAQDRRTTPPALRLPGLVFLLLMAGYQALAFRYALSDPQTWPDWLKEHSFSLWPATWSMFTTRDRSHTLLEARARYPEGWQDVDLNAVFPSRWESGPRYIRKPFWRSRTYNKTLAWSLCGRLERRPLAVEITKVEWRKTLGQVEQPRKDEERTRLIGWDCEERLTLPQGRRL